MRFWGWTVLSGLWYIMHTCKQINTAHKPAPCTAYARELTCSLSRDERPLIYRLMHTDHHRSVNMPSCVSVNDLFGCFVPRCSWPITYFVTICPIIVRICGSRFVHKCVVRTAKEDEKPSNAHYSVCNLQPLMNVHIDFCTSRLQLEKWHVQ